MTDSLPTTQEQVEKIVSGLFCKEIQRKQLPPEKACEGGYLDAFTTDIKQVESELNRTLGTNINLGLELVELPANEILADLVRLVCTQLNIPYMTEEYILAKITPHIADALSYDGEITPQTSFLFDLDAESIDMKDCEFRLAKEFKGIINDDEDFRQIFIRPIPDKFTVQTIIDGIRANLEKTGKLEVGASSREVKLEKQP